MNPKVILICRVCDEIDCRLHHDMKWEYECDRCLKIHTLLRDAGSCCSQLGDKSDPLAGRQTSPPPKEPRVAKQKSWGFNNRGDLNTPTRDVYPHRERKENY